MSCELKNPIKGLISIKNNDIKNNNNKNFFWCNIRHLNPLKRQPERITKADKKINDIDDEGIKFPVSNKDFNKIEKKNNICINVFCYENKLTHPVHISNQTFESCMNLLMISDESKSHYVYINF